MTDDELIEQWRKRARRADAMLTVFAWVAVAVIATAGAIAAHYVRRAEVRRIVEDMREEQGE